MEWMKMKKLLVACAAAASTLFLSSAFPVNAQVVINGYHFYGQELAELESLLGTQVPDGFYWLDTNTGDWGYEGDSTVQGNIFYQQESNSSGSGGADSYYDSSGGGYSSYASDGECAYFSTEYGSVSTCD
jgi:hypothetical protein